MIDGREMPPISACDSSIHAIFLMPSAWMMSRGETYSTSKAGRAAYTPRFYGSGFVCGMERRDYWLCTSDMRLIMPAELCLRISL